MLGHSSSSSGKCNNNIILKKNKKSSLYAINVCFAGSLWWAAIKHTVLTVIDMIHNTPAEELFFYVFCNSIASDFSFFKQTSEIHNLTRVKLQQFEILGITHKICGPLSFEVLFVLR